MMWGTYPTLPSFIITDVEDSNLESYRKTEEEVKKKNKDSQLTLDYILTNKKLTVKGTSVDIYWFGYFSKQFENE